MSYRKILAIGLPIIITCSIVGVGFSSWFFGHEDLKTDTKNISITTTSAVDKGTLSIVSAPSKIVFSQGKGNVENLKDGIDYYQLVSSSSTSSYYSNNDKIVIKYSLKDKNDAIDGSNFRLFISFSGTSISSYIKLTTDYSDCSTTSGYDYSSYIVDNSSLTSDSDPYGYFEYTLELSKVIEFYSVDIKPTTIEKYNSIKTALVDATININFTCD